MKLVVLSYRWLLGKVGSAVDKAQHFHNPLYLVDTSQIVLKFTMSINKHEGDQPAKLRAW